MLKSLRVWIFEVTNFSALSIVLTVIVYLQIKYLSIHHDKRGFLDSPRKRKLVITTVVLLIAIIYRTVLNLLKPILGKDPTYTELSLIDSLET